MSDDFDLVIVTTDEKRLYFYRDILSDSSDFFKALLTNGCLESSVNTIKLNRNSQHLNIILNFIYNQHIIHVTTEKIQNLKYSLQMVDEQNSTDIRNQLDKVSLNCKIKKNILPRELEDMDIICELIDISNEYNIKLLQRELCNILYNLTKFYITMKDINTLCLDYPCLNNLKNKKIFADFGYDMLIHRYIQFYKLYRHKICPLYADIMITEYNWKNKCILLKILLNEKLLTDTDKIKRVNYFLPLLTTEMFNNISKIKSNDLSIIYDNIRHITDESIKSRLYKDIEKYMI